jgi:hypothetical protein
LLTIHPQNRLADIESSRVALWYVYRDGRVRRKEDPRLDRLYAALGTARETTRAVISSLGRADETAASAGFAISGPKAHEPSFIRVPIEPIEAEPQLAGSEANDRN